MGMPQLGIESWQVESNFEVGPNSGSQRKEIISKDGGKKSIFI